MNIDHEKDRELAPEERRWIDALGAAFRPEPMDRRRAGAFQRQLDARLERRRLWVRGAVPALALASGAAALWLYVAASAPAPETGASASLYAFADPDAVAADLVEPEAYLPDDYRLLASLMEEEPAR
jgi:hypothetical protein